MSENLTSPEALPTIPEKQEKALRAVVHDDSSILLDSARFEHLQRVAMVFSSSTVVPEIYQGNPANCFVACHMAHKLELDPFVFMQNSFVVKGKPGIEGKLVIALINSRGPYPEGIQWEMKGSGDSREATAFGVRENGKRDEFTVTYKQAKDAGWAEKNPNWRNLTDLMLHYRSATFLARTNCPEVILGLDIVEELRDINGVEVVSRKSGVSSAANLLLEGN